MARNYKQGTLAERLAKKADDELQISQNAAALFNFLKPEYERWNNHKGEKVDPTDPNSPFKPFPGGVPNAYVIRTAVDNMVSSERDLAHSEDLREASDIIGVVQGIRDTTEVREAVGRLKGVLEGTYRYTVYRGEPPEGVPTSKRDQALVLLMLDALGVEPL